MRERVVSGITPGYKGQRVSAFGCYRGGEMGLKRPIIYVVINGWPMRCPFANAK